MPLEDAGTPSCLSLAVCQELHSIKPASEKLLKPLSMLGTDLDSRQILGGAGRVAAFLSWCESAVQTECWIKMNQRDSVPFLRKLISVDQP